MLSGAPPFYSKDKQKMLDDRLNKSIIMREFFSADAVNLLKGLLNNNPKQRSQLGYFIFKKDSDAI
jgi:hypothetical protein